MAFKNRSSVCCVSLSCEMKTILTDGKRTSPKSGKLAVRSPASRGSAPLPLQLVEVRDRSHRARTVHQFITLSFRSLLMSSCARRTLLFITEGSFLAELGLKWDYYLRWLVDSVEVTCTVRGTEPALGCTACLLWLAAQERISVKVKVRFSAVPFPQPTMFCWLKLTAFLCFLFYLFIILGCKISISLCGSATETNITHSEIPRYNQHERCCCDRYRMNTSAPPAWCLQ